MSSCCDHNDVIQIEAGPHDRKNAVVTVDCEPKCSGGHTLTDLDSDQTIPVQCKDSQMTFIIPQMAAGEVKRYQFGPPTQAEGGVTVEKQDERCQVFIDGNLLTEHVFGGDIARPYCYPLHGPGGVELTNFAPKDHVHHKSLYIAHGEVNGYNNWDELEGHARTVVNECEVTSGPVYGEIRTVGDWMAPKDGKPGVLTPEDGKLLREETRWRFYNLSDTERLLDVTTTWTAAYQGVLLGDTKEAGTIAVRVNEQMEVSNGGQFINAYGGINDAECWGKRTPWVDYFGTVDGQQVGLAIFDHPTNLRHPTWWHVRGYGLFTANCWGLHDFVGDFSVRGDYTLGQDEALSFNFRLYVHAGDTQAANVGGRYLDYAFPPQAAAN